MMQDKTTSWKWISLSYETIYSELRSAAYKYYEKEYMDYYAEGPDDEPGDIELTGEEYKCPIPEDW